MRFSTVLTTAVTLASTAHGLTFLLDYFTASDTDNDNCHYIQFQICDPDAAIEQGSQDSALCTIQWQGDVPTCWSQCDAGGYYARVTAGSFNGAANFSLDIWEAYVSEIGFSNRATIPINVTDESTDYVCTYTDTTLCNLQGVNPFTAEVQPDYQDGADPIGTICQ